MIQGLSSLMKFLRKCLPSWALLRSMLTLMRAATKFTPTPHKWVTTQEDRNVLMASHLLIALLYSVMTWATLSGVRNTAVSCLRMKLCSTMHAMKMSQAFSLLKTLTFSAVSTCSLAWCWHFQRQPVWLRASSCTSWCVHRYLPCVDRVSVVMGWVCTQCLLLIILLIRITSDHVQSELYRIWTPRWES